MWHSFPKKQVLLFGCFFLLVCGVEAQREEKAYKPNDIVLSAGYGFPNIYSFILKTKLEFVYVNNFDIQASYAVERIGPGFLKIEYGVDSLLSMGATLGYSTMRVTQTVAYTEQVNDPTGTKYMPFQDITTIDYSSLSLGGRLNFHVDPEAKIDPYAGLSIGYTINTVRTTFRSDNPSAYPTRISVKPNSVYVGVTMGIRYYINENFGIYGEVGFDKWSLLQGGLVYKL